MRTESREQAARRAHVLGPRQGSLVRTQRAADAADVTAHALAISALLLAPATRVGAAACRGLACANVAIAPSTMEVAGSSLRHAPARGTIAISSAPGTIASHALATPWSRDASFSLAGALASLVPAPAPRAPLGARLPVPVSSQENAPSFVALAFSSLGSTSSIEEDAFPPREGAPSSREDASATTAFAVASPADALPPLAIAFSRANDA